MIIYKVTNLENNKVYIGKTKQLLHIRKKQHETSDKDTYFNRALRKYNKFDWDVIDIASSEQELNNLERYWITYYSSFNKNLGYNLTRGGEGVLNPSKEVRRKMSDKQLGIKNSNYQHGKYSGKHFCSKCSKELENTNTAILCKSCCKKGLKYSKTHKLNISLAKMGTKNPAKRDEVRRKISETVKKRWQEGCYSRS